jgi:hypothetical protein
VTQLRRIMLEELQRLKYADSTARYYLRAVEKFARYFGKSPDKLGLEHLRAYQAYLLKQPDTLSVNEHPIHISFAVADLYRQVRHGDWNFVPCRRAGVRRGSRNLTFARTNPAS